MIKAKKSIQILYTMIQSLYWVCVGFSFSYASVYLQNRGVPNVQIGLVLAAAYVLAAVLQPMIAAVIDRWEIPLARCIILIYGLAALLAVLVYVLPLPTGGLLVLLAIDFALIFSMQSCINSLAKVLDTLGYPVNFGAARGTCSLVFAVAMALTGQVLRRVSPMFLPLSYAAVSLLIILLLLSFRPILHGKLQVRSETAGSFPSVRQYPMFWLFLCAALFLSVAQEFYASFMLQIMQNVGGDSGNVGLAVGINAAVEFLPMLFYSRLSKRFGVSKLMVFAGWAWVVKSILFFMASSPAGIYAANLTQSVTYALYVPGSIELVSKMLPEKYFLKGQSLAVSAFTVGCVAASLLGGMLLDTIGATGSLGILVGVMIAGAVIMSVCIVKRKNS